MRITDWARGTYPKKYSVMVDGTRVQFGDQRYEQYEDKTPLKLYKHLDHRDGNRRRLFHSRHRGSDSLAGILSKKYLW